MIRVILLALISVLIGMCSLQAYAQGMREKAKPTYEGVPIPLRDGAFLASDIYLPKASGKYPAILIITPYNRKLMGAALPDPKSRGDIFFDRNVYTIVVVDWRGFFGSKGSKSRTAKPGEDGYDTVEWIAKQPWSNGKVGMWGPSALGKIQLYTSIENPPHLVCGVPIVCQLGYSYGQFFHGGVLKKAYIDTVESVGFNLRRVKAHPVKDSFWKAVEAHKQTSRINIPLLLISGWYDLYTEGIFATFNEIQSHGGPKAREAIRVLMGPWNHSNTGKLKQGDLEFPKAKGYDVKMASQFFDYWLRDKKDNGWGKVPVVQYYQFGSEQWMGAERWPIKGSKDIVYYLLNDGKLASSISSKSGKDCFEYDPDDPSPTIGGMTVSKFWDPKSRKVSSGPMDQRVVITGRNDFVKYTTENLDNDIVIKGSPHLKLYIYSDQKDTDLAVRLCDRYPDGRLILVSDGIRRVRYRNSFSKQELMEPGKVYEVPVRLSMSAYTFKKGHQICIIVSSSNYPRFDVNPNIDRRRLIGPKTLVAHNCVMHGQEYPSLMILPDFTSP